MNPGFDEVMGIRGRGMPAAGEVTIKGQDPVFAARFRIGETTANILAGVGVAVTDIHEMKTGRRQKVAVDVRHAAAAYAHDFIESRIHSAFIPRSLITRPHFLCSLSTWAANSSGELAITSSPRAWNRFC